MKSTLALALWVIFAAFAAVQACASAPPPAVVGYDRLDTFGRANEVRWVSGGAGNPTLYAADDVTYDASGNRTRQRITQATYGGQQQDNKRSWIYGYDDLDRLVQADRGKLNPAGTQILTGQSANPPRLSDWTYDILGNWAGTPTGGPGTPLPGLLIEGLNNVELSRTTHATGFDNRLNSVTSSTGGGSPQTVSIINDKSGRLVGDGIHFHQYDAWGRLLKVSQVGSATFNPSTGEVTGGTVGPWVRHYAYDGLGRLIRAQEPWPAVSATANRITSQRYFYDGVRRVQEVHTVVSNQRCRGT